MIPFDILSLKKELTNLEEKTKNPEFWQNIEESTKTTRRMNLLKSKIEKYLAVENNLNNIIEMNEIVFEEKEESLESELQKSIIQIEKEIGKLEINTLL